MNWGGRLHIAAWPGGMLVRVIAIAAALVGLVAFGGLWSPPPAPFSLDAMPRLAARPMPSVASETDAMIRFLSERVNRDPEDFVAQNMLASCFLQRLRETSNVDFMRLAAHAARASLASVPAERNVGGLSALAHAEFAGHEFVKARDRAIAITQIEPGKGAGYALLGDTLLELGEYDKADAAFARMQQLGFAPAGTEIRLARVAVLRGDTKGAGQRLIRAIAFALDQPVPPRETVAWCYWQLGELAFSAGAYEEAEKRYRDALTTLPGYMQALPSLGRVRAARGDLTEAIQWYERAVGILPDLTFVAALGDLYQLAGRRNDAEKQYALVEQIGRLAAINGAASNRQLTIFHADHGIEVEEAHREALKEYKVRRDIYGDDALAWSALKAGRPIEAEEAMRSALRLGTQDAKLLYHAGMIERAQGRADSSRDYLKRAIALNPEFDPLQAAVARRALAEESVKLQ